MCVCPPSFLGFHDDCDRCGQGAARGTMTPVVEGSSALLSAELRRSATYHNALHSNSYPVEVRHSRNTCAGVLSGGDKAWLASAGSGASAALGHSRNHDWESGERDVSLSRAAPEPPAPVAPHAPFWPRSYYGIDGYS